MFVFVCVCVSASATHACVKDHRFLHRKFTDFAAVKATIEEETVRLAGKGKGVANAPIVLRVHSPTTIPLTLVDTPGLTRIAVSEQVSLHCLKSFISSLFVFFCGAVEFF